MRYFHRSPLYSQLKEYLLRLIASNLREGKTELPSEVSLSLQFNVSRTSSRRAMQDLAEEGFLIRKKGLGSFINPALSPKNREILQNYSNEQPAVSPNISLTRKTVAVILPCLNSRFTTGILDGIQKLATECQWDVIIAASNYNLETELMLIRKFLPYCHGLIISTFHNEAYNKELIKLTLNKFPLVVIDNFLHGIEHSSITSDNKNTTYAITERFIRQGKKHIGIISYPFHVAFPLRERYLGYEKALLDNHFPIDKKIIGTESEEFGSAPYQAVEKFLIQNPQLDALLLFQYEFVLYVLEAIKNGKTSLQAKDVVVFDEQFEEFYPFLQYKPSYVRQNTFKIGQTAFSIVLEKSRNPHYLDQHVVIPEEIFFAP